MSLYPPQKGITMNLFIGDSLGLPNEQARFEDTIPYLLRGDVWVLCHTGATVTEFKQTVMELSKFIPEGFFHKTVIQLGLADCAPRPIAGYLRKELSRLKPVSFRKWIIKFLHNHRAFIQKHIGYYQRTPYEKFEQAFDVLLKMVILLSGVGGVVVILMPPVVDSMAAHSPGVRKEIIRYNHCMEACAVRYGVKVIDAVNQLEGNPDKYLTNNGHLAKDGFKVITDMVGAMS